MLTLLLSYLLYRLFTALYPAVAILLAPFSGKIRKWVRGRRHWVRKAEGLLQTHPLEETPRLWMHCASLGEFEQGLPILEAFKKRHPRAQVFLTFFSPSGYEMRKQHPLADWVMYLPMDSPRHARRLLEEFRPTLAIFVKYEFWWFYLRELQRRDIPAFLVAARFRPSQPFFKPFGKWHRRMLFAFRAIMVQDERSVQLLKNINYTAVHLCGDPRVDRVLELAEQAESIEALEQFTQGGRVPLFIVGSSWPADEKIYLPHLNRHLPKGMKVLIAPHEVGRAAVERLMQRIQWPVQRYTRLPEEPLREDTRVLILDTVGLLSRAYRYGQMAYIGGGFGKGIHNILEPAAFGLPVIFGPNYHHFEEAVQLIAKGAAFSVRDEGEFAATFDALQDGSQREKAKRELRLYLRHHRGAASCCLEQIEAFMRHQPPKPHS